MKVTRQSYCTIQAINVMVFSYHFQVICKEGHMAPFIGFIHSGECCVMRQVSGQSLSSLEVSVSHVIQKADGSISGF
jgi:hypothetical protein